MRWADLYFPPINLWNYPKQNEDYMIAVWKIKDSDMLKDSDMIKNQDMIKDSGMIKNQDMINNPSHYTHGGIETIDYIEAKGLDKNFNLANVIKYVSRAGYKVDKVEDLKKAMFYLAREIKKLELE